MSNMSSCTTKEWRTKVGYESLPKIRHAEWLKTSEMNHPKRFTKVKATEMQLIQWIVHIMYWGIIYYSQTRFPTSASGWRPRLRFQSLTYRGRSCSTNKSKLYLGWPKTSSSTKAIGATKIWRSNMRNHLLKRSTYPIFRKVSSRFLQIIKVKSDSNSNEIISDVEVRGRIPICEVVYLAIIQRHDSIF